MGHVKWESSVKSELHIWSRSLNFVFNGTSSRASVGALCRYRDIA
jgi:hypothetical protein